VARHVANAGPRQRATLAGVVRSVCARSVPCRACDVVLDDGTGTILVRWLGRESIAGVVVGATLEVEGTLCVHGAALCILNPLYRFGCPGKG
jgi:hypothetical protein